MSRKMSASAGTLGRTGYCQSQVVLRLGSHRVAETSQSNGSPGSCVTSIANFLAVHHFWNWKLIIPILPFSLSEL